VPGFFCMNQMEGRALQSNHREPKSRTT